MFWCAKKAVIDEAKKNRKEKKERNKVDSPATLRKISEREKNRNKGAVKEIWQLSSFGA